MSYFVFYCYLFICKLPWLGKRELICLLSFTCNYVVSVRGGFLFGEVSSSSWCFGWAALFYCGTHCAFHKFYPHSPSSSKSSSSLDSDT